MIKHLKKLTLQELKALKRTYPALVFNVPVDLVYEAQIPNTGIVLLGGSLSIVRKKRVLESVAPGHLLGLRELLSDTPSSCGCKVEGNAEVILLQKSDVLEALDDEKSVLFPLLHAHSAS